MVAAVGNSDDGFRAQNKVLRFMSSLVDRMRLAEIAGVQFGGKRKLYDIFGYKKSLRPEDMWAKYSRQDIAARIINLPPEATWSLPPELDIGNGIALRKWNKLAKEHKLWNALFRADRLARLGRFSVLVIGTNDGARLDRPLTDASELLYVRPYGERQINITEFEDDPRNPRFGLPRIYEISFDSPTEKAHASSGATQLRKLEKLTIHHSRVIHYVENPLEDEVFGTPIMEQIYNVLDDLLKVAGGTAETYWLTANRGMQADVDKEMEIDSKDAEELADHLDEYMHQLRRVIRTRGIKLNVLGSDPPHPKDVFEMLMAILSGATGIPRRILMGSEAGQLASEQDRANWAERIEDRRVLSAQPYLLDPLIGRFMAVGILRDVNDWGYKWPEAFRVSPLERAQTMAAQARAVGNLSRQIGNNAPMQITSRQESREIIGLQGDLPESEIIPIVDPRAVAAGNNPKDNTNDSEEASNVASSTHATGGGEN